MTLRDGEDNGRVVSYETLTKWLVSILASIIVVGGGAWVGYMQSQLTTERTERLASEARIDKAVEIGILRNTVTNLENRLTAHEADTRDVKNRLDDLLGRRR
jgi:hypothetical protein